MTETAFNLVDEPWIRVLQPDGTAAGSCRRRI